MHDIRYDAVHDEIFVTNPFAQAILVFRGGATGEEAPIRIIQGPHTLMSGSITAGVDRIEVDPIHNEIFVPSTGSILVFPRDGNGDVSPIRVLKGPDANLRGADSVAIDPVHDVMIVGGVLPRPGGGARGGGGPASAEDYPGGGVGGGSNGALMIFNRTDSGNVKPKAIIGGPKAAIIRINQLVAYPPKGLIVAAQPGAADKQEPEGVYIGVWSIDDSGDVAPRWFIPGTAKSVMKKPRGVTIDPKHKELIVADMRLNAVLTYYLPEIF